MDIQGSSLSTLVPGSYYNGKCGYCGKANEDFSYYVYAIDLIGEFYRKLLDRGWRRSGCILYKPDQRASCCPLYTIRVDSLSYCPTKDQRQTLNRFNKKIIGQKYIKEAARLYPRTREQVRKRKQDFDLVERIHESELFQQKTPLAHDQSLLVTLEPCNFTEEKFNLYENYQRVVHHQPRESITRRNFRNFICVSPLRNGSIDGKDSLELIGTYHQCYRIDGNLIAMGVLDLLPSCVSSVYFLYHDSVRELGFGKLSAMREIALAKEKGYQWWYPGFYIHDNIKMRVKANYSPQQILCPESYQWLLFTKEIKTQLDFQKYIRFSNYLNNTHSIQSNEISLSSSISYSRNSYLSSPGENKDDQIPLFARNIPGILTREQIISQIDLGSIIIRINDEFVSARTFEDLESNNISDQYSVIVTVAEVASAVGPELCKKIIVCLQ